MKIATVVGARPQFVKLGPLSRLFRNRIKEVVIHTGQHYDYNLSKIFFKDLGLPEPEYNLGINPVRNFAPDHGHKAISNGVKAFSELAAIGRMLMAIENVLLKEKPDLVLTYGDTNSTLAAALVSSKLNIPLAHVEAGVRCFDRRVPEEMNRLIIDRLSELLFCPTRIAVVNLKKEGIRKGVFYTGDVMAEILKEKLEEAEERSSLFRSWGLNKGGYILVTLHRPENVDKKENLEEIIAALTTFKERLVFPIHPRTRKNLKRFGLWSRLVRADFITLLPPQGYLDFLKLEKNAARILTDSGGVQKEAYLLQVPCLTLRRATEWPETVESGWNRLVRCRREDIFDSLKKKYRPHDHRNIFGYGRVSEKIFKIISSYA